LDRPEIDGWDAPPAREPLFRAPWTIVALSLALIALYALQSFVMTDAEVEAWGVTPVALAAGRWETLLTSLFLHGSWPHVLLNSVAIIAFGPPVARLMGTGPRGAAVFYLFYLVCGVLSGLGFAAADALFDAKHFAAVGASGAVSGLLGAASRMIQGHGQVGPIWGSTVLGMAAAWVFVNVVLGVSGLTPGAEGIPVAWQAHLAGYAAGVLLVGPFARLAGRSEAFFTR
jgi:membrane associated rhomboid family serine protease